MAKKKRQRGRPVGTYQKRKFIDTDLGRFIYLHEPLIYQIVCPQEKYGLSPDIHLIEKIVGCSDNPSFGTERFQKYLDDYRKNGLRVPRTKPITEAQMEYHRNLRLIRAMNYLKKNKADIEAREQLAREIIQMKIDSEEGA